MNRPSDPVLKNKDARPFEAERAGEACDRMRHARFLNMRSVLRTRRACVVSLGRFDFGALYVCGFLSSARFLCFSFFLYFLRERSAGKKKERKREGRCEWRSPSGAAAFQIYENDFF